jgi:hypothetical protein
MAERLSPYELDQKRSEFDAVVRSRRLRPHAIDVYRVAVTAQDHDRWALQVQDGNGDPVGIELSIRRVGQHYELLNASLR